MAKDLDEALCLLRDAELIRTRGRSKLKVDAAIALFDDLTALHGQHGLSVRREHPDDKFDLVVQIVGSHPIAVSYTDENDVRLNNDAEVHLDFDSGTRLFVAREPDKFRIAVIILEDVVRRIPDGHLPAIEKDAIVAGLKGCSAHLSTHT